MNRRTLLGRFAAIAAAVMLAPAVKAEVEPEWAPDFDEPLGKPTSYEQLAASFRARSGSAQSNADLMPTWLVSDSWQLISHDGPYELTMGNRGAVGLHFRDLSLT